MPTQEYWNERFAKQALTAYDRADDTLPQLKKIFRNTYEEMNKEIAAFYGKYGKVKESPVFTTLDDGTRIATGTSKKVIVDPADARKYKRLDSLQKQLDAHLVAMSKAQNTYMATNLKSLATASFNYTMYEQFYGYGTGFGFTLLDPKVVEQLINNPVNGQNFSTRVWNNRRLLANRVNQTLNNGIIQGQSTREMSKRLAKDMNSGYSSAERLMRTEITNTYNQANLNGYMSGGLVQKYEFLATLDSRTSEVCTALDGQVYNLDKAVTGLNFPPLHPNCYDKETEVFTDSGWKLFKDLSDDDKMLSVDPETLKNEYIKPVKHIAYHNTGEMIHFKNSNFDMMVTPDHNMLVKYNKKDSSGKWRFVKAKDMPKWNNQIYRGLNYEGDSPKTIKLGDYDIPTNQYCKFMGYYLSEGSSTKIKDKNSYRVKIAQVKYRDEMYEDLKSLPFKVTMTQESINIYDYSVGKELKRYGYSYEKYVPEIIGTLSKEHIEIFLDAYILGDGSVKESNYKGGNFESSKSIHTSSKRMADDLGLLILKVGGRPSYRVNRCKGKKQEFRNGTYTINHDVITVNWLHNTHASVEHIDREIVEYDDMVYCVELPKWHTLYVRRNGKCAWSGNCRSTTVAKFDDSIFERRARDGRRTYTVPSDMSAEQWKAIYVDGTLTRTEWNNGKRATNVKMDEIRKKARK